MTSIFESSTLAGIPLKNRLIRSATYEGLGNTDGGPTEDLTNLYVRLAKGGAGAIITGGIGVQQDGKIGNSMCMLDNDQNIAAYQNMIDEVKKYQTPIIAQLMHAGASTHSDITGYETVGPSEIKNKIKMNKTRELSEREIEELINSFITAIERAQRARFDGVQLHVANGYLLSEFISPRLNRRTDVWGGRVENRFRIVTEIIKGARMKVGSYPILMKLSAYDSTKNGLKIEDGARMAKLFQEAGGDAIEVSCGNFEDGHIAVRTKEIPVEAFFEFIPTLKSMSGVKRGLSRFIIPLLIKNVPPLNNYNVPAAEMIKKQVNIPIIVVGGIRKLSDMVNIILQNKADYIAMCRPFIIEPDIVNKLQNQDQEDSCCIECGYCLYGVGENSLRCYFGKIKNKG